MIRTQQIPESSILVGTPAEQAWYLLAENFDHLDAWSSGLDRSEAIKQLGPDVGAPVAGRIGHSSTPPRQSRHSSEVLDSHTM